MPNRGRMITLRSEFSDRSSRLTRRNKKRRLPEGKRRLVLIVTRKEELLCLWQAWQRPTLPGLKP